MFIAPLYKPYHYETQMNVPGHDLEKGVPVYLDGFAYAGVMNVQTMQPDWPCTTTAKGFMEHSALEALHLQSTPDDLEKEPEGKSEKSK